MKFVNDRSLFDSERKLARTITSQNKTYINFSSVQKLPSLDMPQYYKSLLGQPNQEIQDLLHFPLLDDEKEENQMIDQKNQNQTFTSFTKILEQNKKSLIEDQDQQDYDYLNYQSHRDSIQDINKTNTSRNFLHLNRTYYNRGLKAKTEFSQSNDQLNFELNHNQFILDRLKSIDDEKQQQNEQYIQQKYVNQLMQYYLLKLFTQQVQKLIKHYPSHFKKEMKEQQEQEKINKEKNQTKNNKIKSNINKTSKRESKLQPIMENLNEFVFDQQITKVYWQTITNETSWKPDFRYQSSLIQEGNKAYLYGGIGMSVKNELIEIDLKDFSFKLLNDVGDKPSKRYANGMISFTYPLNIQLAFNPLSGIKPTITNENTLVIIQGQMPYNPQLKIKECQSDVKLLSIDKYEWKNLRTNIDGMPDPRRSFGCCVVGKGIIVHGGLNGKQNYLKDIHYLNLSICKWVPINTTNDVFPEGLGYGQMLTVYTKPQSVRVSDYRQEINNQKKVKIKQEGIYVLGGCYQDVKYKEVNYYPHFLAILKVDCGEPFWIIPETSGQQPDPRTMHTAVQNRQLHSIIVFGGRNDRNENLYYNDIYLLKLETLQWIQLEFACTPKPRAGHCAITYDTKMLVIGGINIDGYLPMNVEIVELDRGKVRQLIEQEKLTKKEKEDQKKVKQFESTRPESIKKSKKTVRTIEPEDIEDKTLAQETKQMMMIKSKIEYLKFSNFNSEVPIPGQRISIRAQKSMNNRELSQILGKKKTNDI